MRKNFHDLKGRCEHHLEIRTLAARWLHPASSSPPITGFCLWHCEVSTVDNICNNLNTTPRHPQLTCHETSRLLLLVSNYHNVRVHWLSTNNNIYWWLTKKLHCNNPFWRFIHWTSELCIAPHWTLTKQLGAGCWHCWQAEERLGARFGRVIAVSESFCHRDHLSGLLKLWCLILFKPSIPCWTFYLKHQSWFTYFWVWLTFLSSRK